MTISVNWIDRFREPTQPANPAFPDGIDVNLAIRGHRSCITSLPYPAQRCGYYSVLCEKCGYTTLITTAGRTDDPRSVRLPCKMN